MLLLYHLTLQNFKIRISLVLKILSMEEEHRVVFVKPNKLLSIFYSLGPIDGKLAIPSQLLSFLKVSLRIGINKSPKLSRPNLVYLLRLLFEVFQLPLGLILRKWGVFRVKFLWLYLQTLNCIFRINIIFCVILFVRSLVLLLDPGHLLRYFYHLMEIRVFIIVLNKDVVRDPPVPLFLNDLRSFFLRIRRGLCLDWWGMLVEWVYIQSVFCLRIELVGIFDLNKVVRFLFHLI